MPAAIGRDFWLYRAGQAVSIVGTAGGRIALAWWVLDRTGSPATLATMIGSALLARYCLGVLLGPLGDRFERKKLILLADVLRGCLSLALAGMFFLGHYRTSYVLAINLFFSLGTALFDMSSKSILPHLVPTPQLREAVRQGQVLMSMGEIAGGLLGGIVVSILGPGGAFLLDGLSYFAAATATSAIRTHMQDAKEGGRFGDFLARWPKDIYDGFSVVLGLPTVVGLIAISVLSNLALAPLFMEWAVLVKEAKNLPPWFLGAVSASFGLGGIVGSLVLGRICRGNRLDRAILWGMALMGFGILLLPRVPDIPGAWVMAFLVGLGNMWTEIPLHTQMTLAMPDSLRARTDSILYFCCGLAAPAGTALAGFLMAQIGVSLTLSWSGALLLCLTPCLALVPYFFDFFRQAPENVADFLPQHFPQAFRKVTALAEPT